MEIRGWRVCLKVMHYQNGLAVPEILLDLFAVKGVVKYLRQIAWFCLGSGLWKSLERWI